MHYNNYVHLEPPFQRH